MHPSGSVLTTERWKHQANQGNVDVAQCLLAKIKADIVRTELAG